MQKYFVTLALKLRLFWYFQEEKDFLKCQNCQIQLSPQKSIKTKIFKLNIHDSSKIY